MAKRIDGRIGLIGNPVEHSLSPAFQQAAFDALGIAVTYELWPTTSEQIPDRLRELRSGETFGANVTVPHKEQFFAAVDEATPVAQRARAVNTLFKNGDQVWGDNTDVYGFLAPLRDRDFEFGSATAVILGAGGAARGVVVALLDAGIKRVVILNRTLPRAAQIAEDLADQRINIGELSQAPEHLRDADLLVNATAVGWEGGLPIDASALNLLGETATAYDLTYRNTPFLEAAKALGLETIDGLPMLVYQGARSFEIWTGEPAPVERMWRAAVEERRRRES